MDEVIVFDMTNSTFEPVDELNDVISWMWEESHVGYGVVEVWLPQNKLNASLVRNGGVLWRGGSSAAMIKKVEQVESSDGDTINVRGLTLECLLETRIVPVTYTSTGKRVSDVMRDLVSSNCISPSDSKRKIPRLKLGNGAGLGPVITYQSTGDSVYESLVDLASSHGLGFCVRFDPYKKEILFDVNEGVDRSESQGINEQIELSTDTEDLLECVYQISSEDYKNVALVAGEGEGTSRITRWVGGTSLNGLDRVELYVDARDVQRKGGDNQPLTDEQYNDALDQRGFEKLAEFPIYESFESKIRIDDGTQYAYGKDYFLGDTVMLTNTRMLVRVPATVTAVEESFDEEYKVDVMFGFAPPTIAEKVNKKARR